MIMFYNMFIIQIEEEIGNIVDISIEISRKEHKA